MTIMIKNYLSKFYKRPLFLFIFVLVGFTILYASFLEKVPVHLNQDELGFTLNAYSIIKTGFDENGIFLPLYFWHLGVMYSTPIIVYLTAIFLHFLPLNEITIRLPSVLVGLLDLILIYILAQKIFNKKMGLVAIFLLATTPIHFIQSRILLDNLYPVPFIIGWMILLLMYDKKNNPWLLFFAALLLGIGIHSYHATKIMMPLYLMFTFIFLLPQLKKNKILILITLIGFILPLLPLIPWLSKYPDTFIDQVKYTYLYDTKLNPVQGLVSLLTPESLIIRFAIYLSYFDPEFLFLKGDAHLIHSTRQVGAFLMPFAILLITGIYNVFKYKRTKFNLLLITGFFTAPLAAAFVENPYRISKALFILPFATLLATYGVEYLFTRKIDILKYIGTLTLMALFIFFIYFLNDYFNDYPKRAYNWFNYNIPGALETAIKIDKEKRIQYFYLDNKVFFIDRYWKFYLIKHHREDVLTGTFYFDPDNLDPRSLPPNSMLIYRFDHLRNTQGLDQITDFKSEIREPDGITSFYLYKI